MLERAKILSLQTATVDSTIMQYMILLNPLPVVPTRATTLYYMVDPITIFEDNLSTGDN